MQQTLPKIYKKYANFKNQKKLLLTIDWLTIRTIDNFTKIQFNSESLAEYGDYVLEHVPNMRTKNFNQFLNVYYQGVKIGNILYESNHPFILQNCAHLRFENFTFYSGEVKDHYYNLCELFGLKNNSISRLDIACDGVNLHKFLNTYLKKSIKSGYITETYDKDFNKKIIKNEDKKGCLDILRVNDVDNINFNNNSRSNYILHTSTNFIVGKQGSKSSGTSRSERYIRYYDKTKELLEVQKGKKQYITDYFEKNEFNLKKPVFRFEIQLNSVFLSKLKDFDITHIFELKTLKSLFLSSLVNFFEFRINDKKNITKCSEIPLFKEFKEPFFVRIKRIVLDSVRTVKIAIKRQLMDIMHGTFTRHNDRVEEETNFYVTGLTRHLIKAQIKRYQLEIWWQKKYPEFLREHKKKCTLLNLEYDKQLDYLLYKLAS